MADEPIGSVSVAITGDYSALEQSFATSQALAQKAGQQISAALESAASGANVLTTATAGVALSVEDLATKSGLAGGELALFRAALQGSADAGVPLEAALKDIAASSAALGTAVSGAAQALSQEQAAASAAVGATDAVGASLKRVRTDAEAFEKAWSEAIAENVKRSTAEFEKFANDVGNFISHPLQSAGQAVKTFLLDIGPMGAVALAGAAALAVVGQQLFSLVEEFGKAAEATGNMADRLNLTWRETRNLEEMAQIAGVSIGGLQQASFRLAEALDGTSAQGKKVAATLQEIGVTGETSGQLLTGFLQKLAQIPDDTRRIALAHEVLGRSSQQIIPLIKNYGDLQKVIAELGPAIGDKLAGDLQKSDDALDKLNISWSRFKEEIAAGAAPAVGALVDQFRMLIVETSKLVQETTGSAKALAGMIPPGLISTLGEVASAIIKIQLLASPFASAIRVMIGALEDFNIVARAVSGKAAEDMAVGIYKMDKALRENLTTSLHAATTGTKEFIDVFKNAGGGVAGAIDNIIAAQSKLADNVRFAKGAYDQLNEALKNGTKVNGDHKVTVDDVARALANLKAAESAAATTKVDHTEKNKALTHSMLALSDSVAIFVKQIENAKSAHQALISDAAALSSVLGRYVSVAEMAAIKTEGMATAYRIFLETFNENLNIDAMARVIPVMDDIAAAINKAKQEALDTDPYAKLAKALDELGIKGQQYFKHLADDAEKNYQIVLASGKSTYEELAAAALKSAEAQIRAELSVNAISREEADKTLKQIQDDLNTLDASHTASAQHRGRTERTLGEDIQAINKRTFDGLERGLADSIVHLKGFGDIWKTLWQGLAKDLLQIMFKTLLDPLEKAIGKVLGGIFGGGGSAAGTAAGGAGSAGGGATSVAGSVVGAGISGIVGAISGAVTAVSSVIGNFQMAGMNKTLDLIENYTRYLKIGLVEQGDSLLNDSHVIRNTLTDMMSFNWGVQAKYFQGISEKLDTLIGLGGIHSPATSSQVAAFAQAAPSARTSEGVTVHVDLSGAHITGGLRDGQVRDILDRGIRMSKLGGAFRPGVFPQ